MLKRPSYSSARLVCSAIMLAMFVPGCKGADEPTSSGQTGASLSPAPTTDAAYGGARNPRKCSAVKHVPNASEAAALSQCYSEKKTANGMYLWQNVQVEIAGSRPYAYDSDSHNSDIDTTAKVYPIRASGDNYYCTGDATCNVQHTTNAPGTCIKTTFGDWTCSFSQVFGLDPTRMKKPVPTAY